MYQPSFALKWKLQQGMKYVLKKSVHLMDSWIVHKNNYAKKRIQDLKAELKSWKLSIYTLGFLISVQHKANDLS